MQNRPMARSCGQVRDVRPGAKTTSGGSSDSELNDWQVKPIGPVVGHRGDDRDAGREVAEHLPHHLRVDDAGRAVMRTVTRRAGTERPPARYSELGSSCPTACSVTRAAARTASRSRPVRTPDSSSM